MAAVMVSFCATFAQSGSIDSAFVRMLGRGTGTSAFISVMTLQRDGKILLGGNFTSFNGVNVSGIVRLMPDGSIDQQFLSNVGKGFQPQPSSNLVVIGGIVEQNDGKILIGGTWGRFNDVQTPDQIIRLNADGTIDRTFSCNIVGSVGTLALQSDGNIIAGQNTGSTIYAYKIAPDGTRSLDFFNRFGLGLRRETSGDTPQLYALATLADNSFLMGGFFARFNSLAAWGLARIKNTGDIDENFRVNYAATQETKTVRAIVIQGDGKILLGGEMSRKVLRLNADGTLDNAFSQALGSGFSLSPVITALGALGELPIVFSMARQSDEKILVGGIFSSCNGRSYNGFCRLNSNGTLDTVFSVNLPVAANESIIIRDIAIQRDNKILLNGVKINRQTSTISYFLTRLNAILPTSAYDHTLKKEQIASIRLFPNPVSELTTVEFDVPQPQPVRMSVVNSLGIEVAQLINGETLSGKQRMVWATQDMPSGVYVVRVFVGSVVSAQTVVVAR